MLRLSAVTILGVHVEGDRGAKAAIVLESRP